MFALNIGDSRTILVSEFDKEVLVSQVTEDHKPELPQESARIIAAGGKVS